MLIHVAVVANAFRKTTSVAWMPPQLARQVTARKHVCAQRNTDQFVVATGYCIAISAWQRVLVWKQQARIKLALPQI
jgi:hypothetical protein